MIFVDTGAWIALSDKSDRYHETAVKTYISVKQRKEKLLTTDYVIDETITRLRYDAGHQIAVKFTDAIFASEKSGSLAIVRIDHDIFGESISIFRKFDSAVLSFTDCTSFAVCKRHNLHKAFAFDRHFTMMGISLIEA